MAAVAEPSRKQGDQGRRRYGHYSSGNGHNQVLEDTDIRRFVDDGRDCERLFRELSEKMNYRYKRYSKLQADFLKRYEELKAEAKALAEEKKLVASWKAEAAATQAKTEKDLMQIRSERQQIERASTDLAVQMAELKRLQRDLSKQQGTGPLEDGVQDAAAQNAAAIVLYGQPKKRSDVEESDDDDVPLSKRMKVSKAEPVPLKMANLKLATVQAALQEDAPGLFELLEEKGLLEDMDIINNVWEEEDKEEKSSSEKDSFEDLAAVVGKLMGPATGLVKETRSRVQSNGASRPSYCLPCLASLIEQTRVLKQFKWPVKWGWCRTLQSFLFVFEKHNRIVVERPEYGYATYFFEIMQSLPIKWQVERLIRVMSSVSNCRAALLENRPLNVGKDLLPQEAEVLKRYGWTPNNGIGSLLNFCDRVLHDYKAGDNEDEAGEWRPKIGKLLMDGHDQGSIVTKVPCTAPQQDGLVPMVKLEEDVDNQARSIVLFARVKDEPS